MKIKPYERNAKYYETDQMGIIHHSNYIRWFEEARVDAMEQAGIPYDKMEEMGIMSPVLGVECKYIHSVHFNENVKIEVRFLSFTGVKMEIEYKVYSMATDELTTTGLSRHGFVHSDTGRPVRMKKEYPDLYAKIMDALE